MVFLYLGGMPEEDTPPSLESLLGCANGTLAIYFNLYLRAMEIEKALKREEFRTLFQKAIVNLKYTNNWVLSKQAGMFKHYGLTTQQFYILLILKSRHPKPCSVNFLIDRMLDKQSNASRLVEKLRLKGLVERHLCPKDRRRVDVVLTELGLETLERMYNEIDAFEKHYNQMNDEELRQLSHLLDRLRQREDEDPPSECDQEEDCPEQ
jgi:DNA-binding MarR family transcriptional regulator